MQKQYLGINTSFDDLNLQFFTEVSFGEPISIFDFDAVFIRTSWIPYAYQREEKRYQGLHVLTKNSSVKIVSDFKRLKSELIDFLNSGRNVYLFMSRNENCYIYTGKNSQSGTGKNAVTTNYVNEFNCLSFLPIDIIPNYVTGNKITVMGLEPYKQFFNSQKDVIYYAAYFDSDIGIPIAKVSKSDKAVSTVVEFGKGKIIILPEYMDADEYQNYDKWQVCGRDYLNSLLELDRTLTTKDEHVFPKWTNKFLIPGEKDLKQDVIEKEKQIEAMQLIIEQKQKELLEMQKVKYLLFGSGVRLEETVKYIFTELGFNLLPTENGRADVCAMYEDKSIVCEIKGLTKSAGERNAAQLEKWAATFAEENNKVPKPILIVNAYKDIPLDERVEDAFPQQMIPYSTARHHCLMTTQQLLCMYIDAINNPANKRERILELINTTGVYTKYIEYNKYLCIDTMEK